MAQILRASGLRIGRDIKLHQKIKQSYTFKPRFVNMSPFCKNISSTVSFKREHRPLNISLKVGASSFQPNINLDSPKASHK